MPSDGFATLTTMGLLASFVRFRLKFDAGSSDLAPAEEAQFAEKRTIASGVPLGYYSQHIFEMKNASGAFTSRERGLFGVHWINLTAGEVDTTWIDADFASVESAVQTFWTTDAARVPIDFRLVEHRWYPYGVSVLPPTPAARVTTLGSPIAGTGSVQSPHQLATTVTLRTGLRRHWGRIYMPLSAGVLSSGGVLSSAEVDGVATAARTMFMVTPSAQGIVPVVYDRNRKLAFGVTAVEVDSVPDIVRRRRPRDTGYRKIFTS